MTLAFSIPASMAAGTYTASSPCRWVRAATFHLFSGRGGGEAIWYFLAVLAVLSLLTHELSRRSVLAAATEFEGFDFDEDEDESSMFKHFVYDTPPPATQSTTPESHHGQPDSTDLKTSSEPSPSPMAPMVDEWDEDEFEGVPFQMYDQTLNPTEETLPLTPEASPESTKPKTFPGSYPMEIAFVSFLIAFAVNFFTGRKENENIALWWAAAFATEGTVFGKNFSLLGTGSGSDAPLLLKEGQDVFKFYASGRRYCQSLLATLELKSRHDLISRIVDLVVSKKETITLEVVMNDDSMDHVVFALARKKLAKAMYKEESDLQKFAGLVLNAPSGRKWVQEDLLVVSESKEVAGDMLTEIALDQVFGKKAFEKVGKWFISMHFSDQHRGSQKKMLRFKFALPDWSSMANMTRLIALIPYYIDLVGRYKPSQQARSKTEATRAKAAHEAYRELLNARQEGLQKKKVEKKKLVEVASAKLSAEALRKKEEKERTRRLKKAMPKAKILRSK